MRSIFDFKPQFKRYRVELPWGGEISDEDGGGALPDIANIATFGFIPGLAASSLGFDMTDPFGTKAAMKSQQDMMNQYRNQQEALMRDEQNRRWQSEISNSWAAYGAQRRSQVMSGAGSGSALGPMSANDLYLGGR